MPKGRYPVEYFANPRIDKPIEEIYAELDEYSMEYFEDEPAFHERIDIYMILPPLSYEGRMLKGIFFSQGVDYLHKLYPQLGELFFSIATSQWASYPWSQAADAYLALYDNPHRDDWFRRTYPDRSQKVLLPLQGADYTHDYVMAPAPFAKRDFDVVCVSRMHDLKNLPMVAEALKVFHRKYRPIRMLLVVGKKFALNFKELTDYERQEWRKIEAILVHPWDYIELIPEAKYVKELPGYYSRAKLCVLGALLEGKNRCLFEATSCDTPVVCFQAFNQYIRARGRESLSSRPQDVPVVDGQGSDMKQTPDPGAAPAFPDGAGLYAPEFDAESLADTFQQVLENHGEFHPRRRFLEDSGRKNFFNKCIDSFPYYETALPDYARGRHVRNLWLDLAIQANYQLSLLDFIFDKNHLLSRVRGMKNIDDMLRFYFGRFGLTVTPATAPPS